MDRRRWTINDIAWLLKKKIVLKEWYQYMYISLYDHVMHSILNHLVHSMIQKTIVQFFQVNDIYKYRYQLSHCIDLSYQPITKFLVKKKNTKIKSVAFFLNFCSWTKWIEESNATKYRTRQKLNLVPYRNWTFIVRMNKWEIGNLSCLNYFELYHFVVSQSTLSHCAFDRLYRLKKKIQFTIFNPYISVIISSERMFLYFVPFQGGQ